MSLMDDVAHPKHYQLGGVETIDVIEGVAEAITKGGAEACAAGNVIKYITRFPRKGGLKDLYKARWYLDRLIRHVENETDGVHIPSEPEYAPDDVAFRKATLDELAAGSQLLGLYATDRLIPPPSTDPLTAHPMAAEALREADGPAEDLAVGSTAR